MVWTIIVEKDLASSVMVEMGRVEINTLNRSGSGWSLSVLDSHLNQFDSLMYLLYKKF